MPAASIDIGILVHLVARLRCVGREGQKREALTGRDDGVRIQGEVEPEGQRDSAQVPKGLVKKFVGGRTMYVPKYDHAKAGGNGWDWLW